MKLVMTLVVRDEIDVLDAHLSYHLNAGVDVVVAAHEGPGDDIRELLESYARDGHLRLVRRSGELRANEWRTQLARIAAVDYDADWVIDSGVHEFWWPRAESLKDALVAIPPRYTVVQALVRRFLDASGDGPRTLRQLGPSTGAPPWLGDWLRPVYRTSPELTLVPRGAVAEPWRVPLRAWYPIEVFDYSSEGDRAADAAPGESDHPLVSDTRLVDALARLLSTGELSIPVPDIVDDASYAVECAALGEADFGPIEKHIEDLEHRIAVLEARFWLRVRYALRRLARRPR